MTSACIFKDALRNHTQVFLTFRASIFEICLHLINLNGILESLLSLMRSSGAGTSNEIPLQESALTLPAILITLPFSFFDISYLLHQCITMISKMLSNNSMASDDSDVFYVEQSSSELSPQRHNTPTILNSNEISEQHTAKIPSISSKASPEPRIFTIDDNSNEPTMPYGFGRQLPIVPPSLNDMNFPPNPFKILNTMASVMQTQDDNKQYSPESPEPSLPSPISTPPMNVSAFNSWETTHTTTDDNTFYSEDEPRRFYWDLSSDDDLGSSVPRNPTVASSPCVTPPPPRAQKRKLSLGMSFPKDGGVSQHICEACGQAIPSVKDTPGPSSRI